ncbi:MAG: aminoglycoside phosphotransferase-like protein [Actinomycetia bacterium]|nr:aminoglycoside phosphotransferase-like protein [Actinomycetes bacterium]
MSEDIPTVDRPKTSTRDLAETHDALERWLSGQLGTTVTISELQAPPTNGMSSETILFEATWDGQTSGLVGRIPPDPANAPVFPTYDIPGQFRTMTLVRELTGVPVPEPLWVEADAAVIGQPFFVMRRVDGVVPPDVMPYTFGDNWLFDGTPEQRQRLQATSIQVLADLHAVPDPEDHFGFLHEGVAGATALRRHFQKELVDYYAWAARETTSPLIERCFAWLGERWPEEGETVLSWGDARIGNILYADFEPVAVLDWEMASLGPREIDVAWLQYLHRFFQDLAEGYGMPGLPDLFRRDDVVDAYEAATGHRCRDMDWYAVLAATRHGVVSLRTGIRGVQFGQAPMPDDVDDLIMHRHTLEQMLDGSYWKDK